MYDTCITTKILRTKWNYECLPSQMLSLASANIQEIQAPNQVKKDKVKTTKDLNQTH